MQRCFDPFSETLLYPNMCSDKSNVHNTFRNLLKICSRALHPPYHPRQCPSWPHVFDLKRFKGQSLSQISSSLNWTTPESYKHIYPSSEVMSRYLTFSSQAEPMTTSPQPLSSLLPVFTLIPAMLVQLHDESCCLSDRSDFFSLVEFIRRSASLCCPTTLFECGVINSAHTYVWLFSASYSSPFPVSYQRLLWWLQKSEWNFLERRAGQVLVNMLERNYTELEHQTPTA